VRPDITLVFPNSPFLLNQQVFPPLGILYLSAWLKQSGYKVQCLDMALGAKIEEAKAGVVGVSFTTPQRFEAYSIAKKCKRMGKITIAGGPHPSHLPDECLKNGFDYAVVGEGETALDALLVFLSEPRLRDRIRDRVIVTQTNQQVRIDKVPFPDREAVDIHAYKYEIDGREATTIMTSRGCPFSCSFCARSIKGCRMQGSERTVQEIMTVFVKYGFRAFMIFDDVFILDKKRTKKIVEFLKPADFIFRCFARSSLIDRQNCELMKDLGVVEVGIGVESGSDEILKRNMKGTTRDMNVAAFKLLHEYGIRPKAFLIVGLPGETEKTVLQTESWIKEAKPYDVDVSIFQPLPGSAIFNDPKRWGISFSYDGKPGWYKGTPGAYETTVNTGSLGPKEIVYWRDFLEGKYKRKELLK
jgi:anaerobic magnesium-protoporphyrin IX monomethyl ester cyclase